jgi:coenzyme F420-reducing hydrogenase beta subunit/polysaccharide pyruvyl transferase WcaK-like protein
MPYIAASREELAAGQRSYYAPNALNEILKSILRERNATRYAFMGLPSHVHGLRLLQKTHPELREKIPYVISCFTAHVPSRRATEYTLYANGISLKDVRELKYRSGFVDGHMVVTLNSGDVRQIPHLDWSYSGFVFPNFFYPVREWLYFDKLSQWADFSMGDNWQAPGGHFDTLGTSTVVARSHAAAQIVRSMIREGRLSASEMTTSMLVSDQELNTKLNIGVRLVVWKMLGRKVPDYTPRLAVRKKDIIRTFRFALYVLLSERHLSLRVMDAIIKFEYLRRKSAIPRVKKYVRDTWAKFRMRISILKRLLILFMSGLRVEDFRAPTVACSPRILMVGGYGDEDIGDEAMPHTVRRNLLKALGGNAQIVMLSPSPTKTKARHGTESLEDVWELGPSMNALREERLRSWIYRTLFLWGARAHKLGIRLAMWPHGREILDSMINSDLLFNVGGGNLNSIMTTEFFKKGTQYRAMRILGKPVIVSGQTVGPIVGRRHRGFARKAMSCIDLLTFRDRSISLGRCQEIGLTGVEMHDAADDAMMLPSLERSAAMRLLGEELDPEWLNDDRPLVLMNMKGSMALFTEPGVERRDLAPDVGVMAELADLMIERLNVKVIFMPTDYTEAVDDRILHREIMARMRCASSVRSIEREYSDVELKGFTQLAAMTVGARYHFHVFAASNCVPFFGVATGVYQSTKLKGLAELCGLPECYWPQDLGHSSPIDVFHAVERLFARRFEITDQLAKVVPQLSQESMTTIEKARELLASDSRVLSGN